MSDTESYSGSCLCGAIRFRLTPPTLFCAHCYCRFCRQAHGAAFVTWTGVPESSFDIEQGEEQLSWFASSRQSQRGFCSRCGTTLLFKSTLAPGEIHIARACIEAEIDREPQAHVFCDHKVDWISITDELPRLDRNSESLIKYQQVEPLPEAEGRE
jgi:hypothetical protein